MNVKIKKIEDFEIGFKRLKNAQLELAESEIVYDYKKASIGLSNLDINEVAPTSFYALRNKLMFQDVLRNKLIVDYKIDLFNLPGILYLEIDNKIVGLAPPFVEVYKEENGEIVRALQDGVHRFLLARKFGLVQKCIVIDNSKTNCKYLPYAYPNSWEEVCLGDYVPTIKKRYRRQVPNSFMRPLCSIFDQKLVLDWSDYGRR